MSTDNKLEALSRIANTNFGMTSGDTFYLQSIAREALAAHGAEQQAGGELARERSARQAAQIELERYKGLLARSRIDLMRELREQGWQQPGEQAGMAAAWGAGRGGGGVDVAARRNRQHWFR